MNGQKFHEERNVYVVSKHLPEVSINYSGENSTFTEQRPGRHHLTQMIKVNIIIGISSVTCLLM
jgi:hypothetical protein